MLGFGAPFGAIFASAAFLVFALGIALFGVISFKTRPPSRGIGLSLLGYAVAVAAIISEGLITGFPTSESVTFGAILLMAVALLAIGYLLRTEGDPPEVAEPSHDTTTN